MKKIVFLFAVFVNASSFGQTVVYKNNFEGASGFRLNTTEMGGSTVAENPWVINNVYTGGTGSFFCTALRSELSFTVPAAAQQPEGIANNPTSFYLHVTPKIALDAGGTFPAASYVTGDGISVVGGESTFASMTTDFSTEDFDSVSIDLWWMCGGGEATGYYGEVYYSTDSGITWSILTCPTTASTQWRDQMSWVRQSITTANLSKQPTLRLGFRFLTGTTFDLTEQNPGFAIDDIRVTGHKLCQPSSDGFSVEGIGFQENTFGDDVKVYPNPTDSELYIDVSNVFDQVKVEVKNMEGKLISRQIYTNSELIKLELAGERGIYLVEVQSGEKRQLYRVVKN